LYVVPFSSLHGVSRLESVQFATEQKGVHHEPKGVRHEKQEAWCKAAYGTHPNSMSNLFLSAGTWDERTKNGFRLGEGGRRSALREL